MNKDQINGTQQKAECMALRSCAMPAGKLSLIGAIAYEQTVNVSNLSGVLHRGSLARINVLNIFARSPHPPIRAIRKSY